MKFLLITMNICDSSFVNDMADVFLTALMSLLPWGPHFSQSFLPHCSLLGTQEFQLPHLDPKTTIYR